MSGSQIILFLRATYSGKSHHNLCVCSAPTKRDPLSLARINIGELADKKLKRKSLNGLSERETEIQKPKGQCQAKRKKRVIALCVCVCVCGDRSVPWCLQRVSDSGQLVCAPPLFHSLGRLQLLHAGHSGFASQSESGQ